MTRNRALRSPECVARRNSAIRGRAAEVSLERDNGPHRFFYSSIAASRYSVVSRALQKLQRTGADAPGDRVPRGEAQLLSTQGSPAALGGLRRPTQSAHTKPLTDRHGLLGLAKRTHVGHLARASTLTYHAKINGVNDERSLTLYSLEGKRELPQQTLRAAKRALHYVRYLTEGVLLGQRCAPKERANQRKVTDANLRDTTTTLARGPGRVLALLRYLQRTSQKAKTRTSPPHVIARQDTQRETQTHAH